MCLIILELSSSSVCEIFGFHENHRHNFKNVILKKKETPFFLLTQFSEDFISNFLYMGLPLQTLVPFFPSLCAA